MLLINVVKISRKLLPGGSYTERLVSQMINGVTGVKPLIVTFMNERSICRGERKNIIKVSQLILGLVS